MSVLLPSMTQSMAVEIDSELWMARHTYGPMRSAHEGFAILLEEVDELWDEVKKKESDRAKMRAEALQVAAMAIRFAQDVCDNPPLK